MTLVYMVSSSVLGVDSLRSSLFLVKKSICLSVSKQRTLVDNAKTKWLQDKICSSRVFRLYSPPGRTKPRRLNESDFILEPFLSFNLCCNIFPTIYQICFNCTFDLLQDHLRQTIFWFHLRQMSMGMKKYLVVLKLNHFFNLVIIHFRCL